MDAVRSFFSARWDKLVKLFYIPSEEDSMAGVIIFFVFLNSVATSIWMFNAWSPFIYVLFDKSNHHVGLLAAVNGFFELLSAFVSGHLSDKHFGPSRTLVYSIYFGLVNLSVVMLGVWTESLPLLVLAQVCEGTYMGLSFTCVESVFAQCLRSGERDRLYSVKFCLESGGPLVGIILSILLYAFVSNEWNISVLRIVMTAGVIIHATSMVRFLMHFVPLPSHLDVGHGGAEEAVDVAVIDAAQDEGDKKAAAPVPAYDVEEPRVAEAEMESHLAAAGTIVLPGPSTEPANRVRSAIMRSMGGPPRAHGAYEPSVCTAVEQGGEVDSIMYPAVLSHRPTSASARPPRRSELADPEDDAEVPETPLGREVIVDEEYEKATGLRRSIMDCIPLRHYPLIVAVSDAVMTLGSGMTTQYFPLFMITIYGISPVTLSMLNFSSSVLIMVMAIWNGWLGARWGRVRALLPPKFVGCALLLYMALTRGTAAGPRWMMCIAYAMRGAMMNCTAGLSRALIMDLVDEKRRGIWNAVESIQAAGWSGTAVIGGFLADSWGYGPTFIVTFGFHVFAASFLLPLTVRNDARLPKKIYVTDDEAPTTATEPSTSERVEPLTAANVKMIISHSALSRVVASSAEGEGEGDAASATQ